MKTLSTPFFKIIPSCKQESEAIKEALLRVHESGHYIHGKELAQFESEFAQFCHSSFAFGIGNGTDALEIALKALEVGQGDQVLTVANAGGFSTCAILNCGGIPVYVEVDKKSKCMCPESLERMLTPQIKAIIVTHLYGQTAEIGVIASLAKKHQVPLIEDCAQAHGAKAHGHHVGTFGDIGMFSFYPTKNLGAEGDAGGLITSCPGLAKKIELLRNYGWAEKYSVACGGGRNSRMDEYQAAILSVKLRYLEKKNQERVKIAERYNKQFKGLSFINTPCEGVGDHVYHLYVVTSKHRRSLKVHLAKSGVASGDHFPIPDYRQVGWQKNRSLFPSLPVTEELCSQVISLPCFPGMTDEEIEHVIRSISSYREQNKETYSLG